MEQTKKDQKLNKMYPRGRKRADRAISVESDNCLVWLASIMYQDYCILWLFIVQKKCYQMGLENEILL